MPRFQEASAGIAMQELMRTVSEDSRRLRDLEDRLDMAESRINGFEKMLIEKFQRAEERLLHLEADLKRMQASLIELRMLAERMERASERFATKVQLREVEKMAELLAPIRAEEPSGQAQRA